MTARPRVCVSRCIYLIAPILKIFVLQTGHVPSVAGRPFFIVICLAFLISRWALHSLSGCLRLGGLLGSTLAPRVAPRSETDSGVPSASSRRLPFGRGLVTCMTVMLVKLKTLSVAGGGAC